MICAYVDDIHADGSCYWEIAAWIKKEVTFGKQKLLLFCERLPKRSRIKVRVSKSSVAIKNIAYTPVLLLIH